MYHSIYLIRFVAVVGSVFVWIIKGFRGKMIDYYRSNYGYSFLIGLVIVIVVIHVIGRIT